MHTRTIKILGKGWQKVHRLQYGHFAELGKLIHDLTAGDELLVEIDADEKNRYEIEETTSGSSW